MATRTVHACTLALALVLATALPVRAASLDLSPERSSLIAWNATLDNTVPVLEFPFSGSRFPLVWGNETDVLGGRVITVRKGRHAYDMRTDPAWKGRVLWVAVANVPGVAGALAEPGPALEADMALAANQYLPASVNLLDEQSYFGVSQLAWLLMACAAVFAAGMLVTRSLKALPKVFLAAFLAGFALLGARGVLDQALLADSLESNSFLARITAYRTRLDALSEKLGGKTWSMEPLSWPYDLQTRYGLAEHPYNPNTWQVRVTNPQGQGPTLRSKEQ